MLTTLPLPPATAGGTAGVPAGPAYGTFFNPNVVIQPGSNITVLPFDDSGVRAIAALKELGVDAGIVDVSDVVQLRDRIILQRCERESRLRQLETQNHILATMSLPRIKRELDEARGELNTAKIDRNEWYARATSAAADLASAQKVVAVVGAVAVLMAIVFIVGISHLMAVAR